MTRELYKTLVAGSSALAMTLALGASAQAFDTVQWDWTALVTTVIDTSVVADTILAPTGINQAENLQEALGDVTADGIATNIAVVPDLSVILPYPIDDLPVVEVGGQAMGNSASITADVSIQYDSLQTLTGLDPATAANITSTSLASGIDNAAVDSAATSVGNSLSVDLAYLDPQNALAIGNNVQNALINASATSTVDGVNLLGFGALGTLPIPVVSSKATAVANNFTANVAVGVPPVPVP
ncbi:hypothetical protein [Mariluticola halotolerans]|uniref:hypothetical protein n=1 Tax=Mariluticola halotolerans TaxID=2909283 RepID=UPI0026E41B91|nr:hypothetical protein [Mariluticola halotolerans]UJQ93410.1 hypothetical protein L1P08_10435 [Mariluticola halotolerans]